MLSGDARKVTARKRRGGSVGARIRRIRLERGLSQRQIAAPGISYAYLARIEAGQRAPSYKSLRTVAAKLEVSIDYLETGEYRDPLTRLYAVAAKSERSCLTTSPSARDSSGSATTTTAAG
jgi:transcriptional regulator with XRE-family HTH domain